MPFRRLTLVAVCVVLISLSDQTQAQQPKLTRVEIGKRGKAASAFVDVPGRGTGTAFCIHSSGLFVTNEHVVRSAEKADVVLVLDPSLETQRVFKAKVVRLDKDLDLALLRVDGAKDLPALTLGSVDGLAELSEVIACGFPLGRALASDRKEYPAISVNAGSVTALRYKNKGSELDHIQIDVALTYGNSGGPILDSNGKVIGVVVSGIPAKGINQAIPVSHLDRFLKRPDIAFVPPELTREGLQKTLEFKASVVSFIPKSPEPTLKLLLRAGEEEPREFAMKKQGGIWVASAKPAATTGASRVEISARIGMANVTGTTEDVAFKVAGKPTRLSSVQRINLKENPGVTLSDGRTKLDGQVTGLGMVEVDLGGQKLKVDLSRATSITVQAPAEVMSVLATVIAFLDGKEVSRTEARMVVREVIRTATADPATVKIVPPALGQERVVKRLPDLYKEVVVGGGGRYLIFHLPKLKKLAIFDISEARITKYIPLAEDDVTFAAGLDSVVIGLKKAGKLETWSLTTFERQKVAYPPFKGEIKTVLLGHGSTGPLVVNGHFLDLATYRQLPIRFPDGGWEPEARLAVSGDGTVFGRWGMNSVTFILDSGELRRSEEPDLGHAIPGPDGKTVFTAKGIAARNLKRGDPDDSTYGYCVPALRGDYFLSITPAPAGKPGGGFTVYLRGLKQPIAKLDTIGHGLFLDSVGADTYRMWSRVFFIPDAKVIAVLPFGDDRIVLNKFDPDDALEKSGEDYLIVTSNPKQEVKAGMTFTYPIKVKSKQGGLTYKLDSAPMGMVVSPAGVVTWSVPASATGDHDVILSVRDKSGQEAFHTFVVHIAK